MKTPPARHPQRAARAAALLLAATALCLLGIWLAPRISEAVAGWLAATPVQTRTLRLAGELAVRPATAEAGGAPSATAPGPRGGASPSCSPAPPLPEAAETVTLDAGMRFSMVGLICDAPAADGTVTVRLRTSLDGGSWSDWQEMPLQLGESGEGAAGAHTDPLWTGRARYLQVGALAAGSDAPLALSGVRVIAIDPCESADAGTALRGGLRRAAARLAGISLVPPAGASVNAPTILTRAQWGADESLRSGSPSFAAVKMAFVHHTASGNSYTAAEGPAVVRGIYAYHTSGLGFDDIGYNFLIDRYGQIYEGRAGGITSGVIGAQVLGFNTSSSGVSLIGTFTSSAPPTAALASLQKLLAWKLDLHGLDPQGTTSMTCRATDKFTSGSTVTLPVIAGHRDANYTLCPGDALYAKLPALRTVVGGLVSPSYRPPTIGISGDDTTWQKTPVELTLTASTDPALPLTRMQYSFNGAAWTSVPGNGTARILPISAEGQNSLRVRVRDAAAQTAEDTALVRIDTIKPTSKPKDMTLTRAQVGKGETVDVWLLTKDAIPCSGRVTMVTRITNSAGVTVGYTSGSRLTSNRTCRVRVTLTATLPPGSYRLLTRATDLAGNRQSTAGGGKLTVR